MDNTIDIKSKISMAPHVRLGDLIEPFDRRNDSDNDYPFYGINREKQFMPSVANTKSVERKRYKIIHENEFVFSGMQTGRDICIRIGLFKMKNPVLLSPAYTLFKLKDDANVLADYIFILFLSCEKDRLGWFLSDASVRSNLDWDRFCDIKIPLPSIEVQREIVAVYEGLRQTAEQNEAMVEPLAKSCHAYIVDCKEKYPCVRLGDYIEDYNDRNSNNILKEDDVRGISTGKVFTPTKANLSGVSLKGYKIVHPHTFAYVADTSRRGDKIALGYNSESNDIMISSIYTTFRCLTDLSPEYLYLFLIRNEFDRYTRYNSWGSARETFDWSEMERVQIPLPPMEVQKAIVDIFHCAEEAKSIANEARNLMKTICPALVQKAAHSL